jgi:hypothetical protein
LTFVRFPRPAGQCEQVPEYRYHAHILEGTDMRIDTTRQTFIANAEPKLATDEKGNARLDRETGQEVWSYSVVVLKSGERKAPSIAVKIVGTPIEVEEGDSLTFTDLISAEYSIDGKNGVSYRAATVENLQ